MSLSDLKVNTTPPVHLHIDSAVARAANWLNIQGWVAGLPRGGIVADSTWGKVSCILSDRPDVCLALGKEKALAYGFTLHILNPTAMPRGWIEVTLRMNGEIFASLRFASPDTMLPLLPFATPKALEMTRRLFLDPATGQNAEQCDRVILLEHGAVAPKNLEYVFDNTRIGNYHSDILDTLFKTDAIGLDIGCGLRDTVFDNMVTQDIYPTPTATLITRPDESRLPFVNNTFDLVVLDSVLEHVPDPIELLMEARRLLKPGGKIFGDAPFLQPLHLAPHHYFNFTPYGLATVAGKAGLHLDYAAAEQHQRPEFSLEWMLRRTFENIPPCEAEKLRTMNLGDFLSELQKNKNLIPYPDAARTELSAGFRFHMSKSGVPCE